MLCEFLLEEGKAENLRRDNPLVNSWSAATRSCARAGEGLYFDMEAIRVAKAFSTRSNRASINLSIARSSSRDDVEKERYCRMESSMLEAAIPSTT